MSPSRRSIDANEFRTMMKPIVTGILAFTTAVNAVGVRHGGIASAESPAMAEISDESDYGKRGGWDEPFGDTHLLGTLTLRAATDYVRLFAEAFDSSQAPLYGHLVLARAALESSVVCWWLSEPGIARDERVKRGLSEYIYSAVEEQRLKLAPDSWQHVQDLIERATRLGWNVTDFDATPWKKKSRGTPRVDGVDRPSIPAGIARLLTDAETSKIGKYQWSRLSAVVHVTYLGLQSAMLVGESTPSPISGQAHVPVGTDAASVYLQAVCVLKALRRTASARIQMMGWQDDEWLAATTAAELLEARMLDAVRPYLASLPV
jgi:hypothetical protein